MELSITECLIIDQKQKIQRLTDSLIALRRKVLKCDADNDEALPHDRRSINDNNGAETVDLIIPFVP